MPAFPPVPNVLKIVISGTYDELGAYQWANVFHWVYGGGIPTLADVSNFADLFYGSYSSFFTASMPASQSMQNAQVTDLSSDTGAQADSPTVTPGTATGAKLPGNACMLISKTINRRYRGGHPRSYMPIGTETNLLDQANWNDDFVTSSLTQYLAFVDDLVGETAGAIALGAECTVSYYDGVDPVTKKPIRRDVPVVYDIPVDGYTARQELASQRGRIGRRR